jgi:hypothetical protein
VEKKINHFEQVSERVMHYRMFLLERLALTQTLEIFVTDNAPKHSLASNHENIVDHTWSCKLTHDKATITKLCH